MAVIPVNPTQADVTAAFAQGARSNGDTVNVAPGTLLWDTRKGQPPLLQALNLSCYGPGVTFRAVSWAYTNKVDLQHIVVMNAQGLSGDWLALSAAQQNAIADIIAKTPPDLTAITPIANACIKSFPDIRDSRLKDANPPSQGQITYNGKTYALPVRWTSGVSKGLFTVKIGMWGSYFRGFKFQNTSGGDGNGAGIRGQGNDLWWEDCTFEDCQDGVLANSPMGVMNPNGLWYADDPPTRFDPYGFAVGKNNTYSGCGSGGLAHSRYAGHSICSIEYGSKSDFANAGNVLKFVGGAMFAIACDVEDDGTGQGELEPGDFNSGYMAAYNSTFVKASAGTGNYGECVFFRNNRNPLAPFMENAGIMRGCVAKYMLKHSAWWVRAQESPTFNTGGNPTWPGAPTPIRVIVRDNVFIAPAGYPVAKPPIGLPASADVGNNVFLLPGDPIPDTRISLPNYELTRTSLKQYVADLLSLDPGIKPGLSSALGALPTYPSGVTVTYFESQEDPAVIADLQNQIAALQKQLADTTATLNQEIATLQADEDAQKAEVARLKGLLSQIETTAAAA